MGAHPTWDILNFFALETPVQVLLELSGVFNV
jgi:hypothetical protein